MSKPHKPRSLNHPAVVKIRKALERAARSPYDEESGLTVTIVGLLVSLGNCCDHFASLEPKERWSPAGARAVAITYAQHAPAAELEVMVEIALARVEWVDWWEREGRDECHGIKRAA